jgi:hypothetical protein
MSYDSTTDTLRHIKRVNELLGQLVCILDNTIKRFLKDA